jgi:DNA-binding transcriptional regulator YiaG
MLDCLKRGGAVRLLRAFARIADYKIRLVLVQAAGHLARRGTRPMKVFTGCGNSCALREHVSRTASRYRARMIEHLARIQKKQWCGPERHVRGDAAIAKDTEPSRARIPQRVNVAVIRKRLGLSHPQFAARIGTFGIGNRAG